MIRVVVVVAWLLTLDGGVSIIDAFCFSKVRTNSLLSNTNNNHIIPKETLVSRYYATSTDEEGGEQRFAPGTRWHSLSPKAKERLIKEGQARAIRNKKKREPAREKKQRMMMYFKKKQLEKKRASKIPRDLSFDNRTSLVECIPGTQVNGKVISLTNFGAYIDIGTECDGLLHISQITKDFFVEHPRQVLQPGEHVTVTIKSREPTLKKLHLTMLEYDEEQERLQQELKQLDYEDDDRIQLEELQVDDELWGELKRVTDFGSYIEVGSVVDGFLHFMDHPTWGYRKMQQQSGQEPPHPSEFMSVGDRVRVWVSDIDLEKRRIKLTANRPSHLPGPRRELPIY